jgi:transcriptional regulator with XRE-family HTH domain
MLTELLQAANKLLDYRRRGAPLEVRFVAALDEACARSSAKALAEAIGISEQYLSDIRRGRRPVSDGMLHKVVGSERG